MDIGIQEQGEMHSFYWAICLSHKNRQHMYSFAEAGIHWQHHQTHFHKNSHHTSPLHPHRFWRQWRNLCSIACRTVPIQTESKRVVVEYQPQLYVPVEAEGRLR